MDLNLNELDDVDQIILNARLRDEIEPFLDESVTLVDTAHMPTAMENEFLASMLAWERAPILPIKQWFSPTLKLPDPATLSDAALHQQLHQVIGRLYEKNIVLTFSEHLSDRELYSLILRDILPAQEKQITIPGNYLRWQCYDQVTDQDIWLRYYASDFERDEWSKENLATPPQKGIPPYPRELPQPTV